MKATNYLLRFTLPLFCLFIISGATAQVNKKETLTPEELEQYQVRVRQLVSFLEFSLNTIGDPTTLRNEKDIIINESFLKAFRDGKVQIEDDLVEFRETPTNKDIQAYFKDVDFFFKGVKFKFDVQAVESYLNEEGKTYFRVTMNRHLAGLKYSGDSLINDVTRYLEVNLDLAQKDLKIVSFYTTRLSQREDLTNWWNALDDKWKNILGANVPIIDSLQLNQIDFINDTTLITTMGEFEVQISTIFNGLKRASGIEMLDLSGRNDITNLGPLNRMENLKTLRIGQTPINDLTPIRNLTKLEILDASGTMLTDLSPLQYFSSLKELNIGGTLVTDLTPIAGISSLERLNLNNTQISDFEKIKGLNALKDLRIAGSNISDLGFVQSLSNLEILLISNTSISDLSDLAGHPQLTELFCDNTPIASLMELKKMPKLKRVYMDNTRLSISEANKFRQENRGVLIIYQSENLSLWWNELSDLWKGIFKGYVDFAGENPSKEILAEIGYINNLNISGRKDISSLEPIRPLIFLQNLQANNCPIENLEPLSNLRDLQQLNVAGTNVSSLMPLSQLSNLILLNVRNTQITSIDGLAGLAALNTLYLDSTAISDLKELHALPSLEKVYADHTRVNDEGAMNFWAAKPRALLVYKSAELIEWWSLLDPQWQQIFQQNLTMDSNPNVEQLHSLFAIEKIEIQLQNRISNIDPLSYLKRIKELNAIDIGLSNISAVSMLSNLEVLRISRNPINNINSVIPLKNLRILEVENTAIADLAPLETLALLEELRASGTQIKKVNSLSGLYKLTYLDISNTNIRTLKPISNLTGLKILRCFNTRLNGKRVASFKASVPDCEVQFY
jgi:Leucine-rich repeat (LRR) protein